LYASSSAKSNRAARPGGRFAPRAADPARSARIEALIDDDGQISKPFNAFLQRTNSRPLGSDRYIKRRLKKSASNPLQVFFVLTLTSGAARVRDEEVTLSTSASWACRSAVSYVPLLSQIFVRP